MAVPSQSTSPPKPGGVQRPLSPHLTIYRWAITMIVSITHRATGVALAAGLLALLWWLIAISNGPESYQNFYAVAATPAGLAVLFGFTWSLAFHLLNGIRHLAWDLGYGFGKPAAHRSAVLVVALSLLLAAGIFVLVWTGHGGYLQ